MWGGDLPELPPSERLGELWVELGRAQAGFAGAVPFEWREVQAFDQMLALDLTPDEATCLVEMSRVYCTELSQRSALRKSPMEREL